MERKFKWASVIVLVLILGYCVFYLTDDYDAKKEATEYLDGSGDVKVVETLDGLFLDGRGNESAIIFYPGAKVESYSYLPMLMNLSSHGVDCYLVEMPFNIAFFGQNTADKIISNSSYSHYFIAGHSLGGVAASSYVNSTNKTDGIILLASYPTHEISKPVLSIYGSKDNVLNREKYHDAMPLIKGNFSEVIISGANHGQFAYYGNQSGDGRASITAENQQGQAVDAILNFIKNR